MESRNSYFWSDSPDWNTGGSASSKISNSSCREDGLSVSSASTSPEIEEAYTRSDSAETSSSLIDPIVLSATKQDGSFPQHETHQKLLSHHCYEQVPQTPIRCYSNDASYVSYHLHPATSPLLSSASTLEPTLFFTYSNHYNTQESMSSYFSNNTTSANSNSYLPSITTNPFEKRYHDKKDQFGPLPSYKQLEKQQLEESRAVKKPVGRFECTVPNCNKVFSRPYNLKSHMRTHTMERPYECPHHPCGWKFARPHDLKRHELQHTGQKPHGCRFCSRRFARSDALKRHWKVDTHCAQALKDETIRNGGKEIPYARKKRSKNTTTSP